MTKTPRRPSASRGKNNTPSPENNEALTTQVRRLKRMESDDKVYREMLAEADDKHSGSPEVKP